VALAFDDADQWVISASKDNALKIYDTRKQMIHHELQTPALLTSMYYSQECKHLFTGLTSGRVVLWDLSVLPAHQLCTIPDSPDLVASSRITALDYDAKTSTLFTGSKDGFALWTVKSSNSVHWGRCVGQIKGINNAPTAVAWINSSREILGSFSNGTVAIFDIDKGEATYVINAHKDEVTKILWLDAPRRLLTASKDKTLKIWDFPSMRRAPIEDPGSAFGTPSTVSVSIAGHSDGRGRGDGALVPGPGSDPLLGRKGSSGVGRGAGGYNEADDGLFGPPGGGSASGASDPLRSGIGRGSGSSVASGYPGRPYSGGDSVPRPNTATTAQPPPNRPKIAGAAPGTMYRSDSDDDLAGWDS